MTILNANTPGGWPRWRSKALVMLALVAACETSPSGPNTSGDVQLSASQSTALLARIGQIAPLHPELAWLGDSVAVVLGSGAAITPIELSTDLASAQFYAVGLQRAFVRVTDSFSTYDIIAFDNPASPTNFIIIDAIASASGATPPTSVTGAFGGGSASTGVNAYLFHIDGNTVSSWRATTGGAAIAADTVAGACAAFEGPSGVTCSRATMTGSFNVISAAGDDGASGSTRHATMGTQLIAGARLRFDATQD